MLTMGSHVSFSGKGLLNAAGEAVSYGANTCMIYTGAPQNTRRKPIEEQFISEGQAVMEKEGISDIVVHAPYIINLASYKPDTFDLAVQFLQEEIRRTNYLGAKNIVLHPGAYTDKDAEYGIARIAEGLNQVLGGVKDIDVKIALETMAGKGTEIGRSFEEIAAIIEKVEQKEKLAVCMDTCHMHDAGYDIVNNFDGIIEQFDQLIGLDRLTVMHINDSKNIRGSSKDRHTPIGTGWIGFDAIKSIVHHEKIRHLPFLLETPWIGKVKGKERPMFEIEIALLQGNVESRFGHEFLDHVEQLRSFFHAREIDPSEFVIPMWEMLTKNAKAKKADNREPIEQLYDMVMSAAPFKGMKEEEINQRLIACIAS